MKNSDLLKQIIGLVSGSILGGIISLSIDTKFDPFHNAIHLVLLIIVTLGGIYSFGIADHIRTEIVLFVRQFSLCQDVIAKLYKKVPVLRNYFKIKVAILSDIDWAKGAQSWASISPQLWLEYIREIYPACAIDLIRMKSSLNKYHILINPYGETYPEYNKTKNETMNKIFDYIKNGGIFVNTAGIPGYYYFNFALQRRIDATPPMFDFTGSPKYLFSLTPFLKELDIRIIGTSHPQLELYVSFLNKNVRIERMSEKQGIVSIVKVKIIKLINYKCPVEIDDHAKQRYEDKSYIFWVPYEKGRVLISTIHHGEINDKKREYVNYLFKLLLSQLNT